MVPWLYDRECLCACVCVWWMDSSDVYRLRLISTTQWSGGKQRHNACLFNVRLCLSLSVGAWTWWGVASVLCVCVCVCVCVWVGGWLYRQVTQIHHFKTCFKMIILKSAKLLGSRCCVVNCANHRCAPRTQSNITRGKYTRCTVICMQWFITGFLF